MADNGPEIDKVKFDIFARIQIRSGRCIGIHCVHFDNSISPSIDTPECADCFRKAMARLEEPPFRGHANGPSGYRGSAS